MNLFLALFWLICTVLLLVYERTVGPTRFRLWLGNHDFSYAWLMVLLVLYNLHRWQWLRSYRAKLRKLQAAEDAHAGAKWRRRSASTDSAPMLDPDFPLPDEPPPSSHRGLPDQPPSQN